MESPSYPGLKAYFKLFNFIAKKRLEKRDVDSTSIHIILTIVLTTAVPMWSHTLVAYLTIDSWIPMAIGIVCSTVHLLSPILLRITDNTRLICNLFLLMGIVHQTSFSFFSGGFTSRTLIWFGIMPMLGGMINGRRGTITWAVFTGLVASTMLILELSGFAFPKLMNPHGHVLSQFLLVFGWIFLSSTIITVFLVIKKHTEKILADQGKKIDDLVRVLFHDLANPLGRIAIGQNITKKSKDQARADKGLEMATQATEAMIEITQNVRKMYAISKGKADMDIVPLCLTEGIEYVRSTCADELSKKNISLEFDARDCDGLMVLAEPVSFKNQVLCNIISNAVKFSRPNKRVYVRAQRLRPNLVEITIQDEGIGMPPHILENLFELNRRTSRIGTNGETGTGFGMHIMKSFVEMYDGTVEVFSSEGKDGAPSGTTFKLFLKGFEGPEL